MLHTYLCLKKQLKLREIYLADEIPGNMIHVTWSLFAQKYSCHRPPCREKSRHDRETRFTTFNLPWLAREAVDEPLERGVGGSEDRQFIVAGQRLDEAGALDQAEQRAQAQRLETGLKGTFVLYIGELDSALKSWYLQGDSSGHGLGWVDLNF